MQVLCVSGAGGGGGGPEEGAQLKVDSVMTVLRPMLEFSECEGKTMWRDWNEMWKIIGVQRRLEVLTETRGIGHTYTRNAD